MRKTKVLSFLVAATLPVVLSACGGGGDEVVVTAPAADPAAVAAAAPEPTAAPTPEEEKESQYDYSPIGKRDPFKSFIGEPLGPGRGPVVTPLQRFDLDQLKLIGIIWGISSPRAMVTTPDRKGYVVQKGTLIGKNWGKVSRISQDEVIISEEFRDFEGRLVVHEIPLKLPKPDLNDLE